MSGDDAKIRELLALLQRVSAADRSVLFAMLETPDSQIATVKGTPNDLLWSQMVELGFALQMELDLELPAALQHVEPRSFALTASGRARMPELLQKLTPGDGLS
jgi:hypothetical protein